MSEDGPRDGGLSLIEVLIAIVIMGIAMAAILGAIGTQIRGADAHRDQSNAQVVLTSAAERVKAVLYSACGAAATSYATAARGVTPPSDWVSTGWSPNGSVSVAVTFWNGTAFTNACNDNVAADTGGLLRMQQVLVTVTAPNGETETVSLVKSGEAP